MNIYTSFDTVLWIENAVLALGAFDGMHVAHRHLVEKLCQDAKQNNRNSVIVSFSSHPRKIISEDPSQAVLTTQQEKLEILAEIGLNNLIIMDFTTDMANRNYIDFIHFLQTKIDIRKIILGYNHHFGKNREGCYDTLLQLGNELHFEVEQIEKQTIGGIPISSSSIREALYLGDIEAVNKMLGYNYSICVQIVYDKNNYQNAIFFDNDKLLPKIGRYIVKIDGCNFFLTVKHLHLSIDSIDDKEEGIYKVEFIQTVQ